MGNYSSFRLSSAIPHVEVDARECLREHTKEFGKEEVVKVGNNVYVAVGFGLANSAMIVGIDGCVIVDTMESVVIAKKVLAAFEPFRENKPIKACILTHNHADHVLGTGAFMEDDGSTEIWGHQLNEYYLRRLVEKTGKITFKRAMRQFGTKLPDSQFENRYLRSQYLQVLTKMAL